MRPTALLLRLYPSRWRARYGDEFAALLEERPLGPFDVADVLLGALDAHRHLRGLGAASLHAKGFAMSLRIGGYAAIAGGFTWLIAMVGSAVLPDASSVLVWFVLAGTLALLVALVGLSAYQARSHPALTWAAFLVPAVGAMISVLGLVAGAFLGDQPFVAGLSPWYVWMIGTITLLLGSGLFALATWRSRSLARPAALLLAIGAVAIVPALGGISGAMAPEPLGALITLACFGAFSAGWIGLGLSALRTGAPGIAVAGGPAQA